MRSLMGTAWPVAFALFCFAWSLPAAAEEVLVSAAASLTDALKEIGGSYETKTRNSVALNFGSSAALARQILEGAPADIFFSADAEKMDMLEKTGRIDSATRRNFLSNRLVLIVALDSRLPIRSPQDLLRPEVKRVVLAEPAAVPAGIYAKIYLQGEGLWQRVKDKIVPVLDARAALAAVESGNVEAGFVYKTDAAISKKVKVAYEVPIDKGPKIVYPAALVKESSKKTAAREFLQFLSDPAAKRIYKKYGFIVLP
ncbi:MAG TPA: molybdate ABC transporter substrate-binding protein [Candidatus Binatia bacterium]|jgi:molybdate transport system substrate-binding protein